MLKIQLQGCNNTRDLGGIVTKDGRKIKAKKLLRSGALYKATEGDLHTLVDTYELRTIIDLRTYGEVEAKPDPQLEGVDYHHNPILEKFQDESDGTEVLHKNLNPMQEAIERANKLPDDTKGFMKRIYPQLVEDDICIQGYRNFFQHLLKQEEGAILWHCSEGKDRVGVGTLLLLFVLGVDIEEIKRDYIYTNNCIYDEVTMLLAAISRLASNRLLEEKIMYMLTVDPEYFDEIVGSIERNYGGLDGFVQDALKLGEEEIEALRNQYLEA